MLEESEVAETNGDKEEPPSFSRIDLSATEADIAAAFPDFPGIKSALECTLEAGTPKVQLESKVCMPDSLFPKLLKKTLHGRIGLGNVLEGQVFGYERTALLPLTRCISVPYR